MDKDNNGSIDFNEFKNFMIDEYFIKLKNFDSYGDNLLTNIVANALNSAESN